jgi:hypothetical protein
VLLSVLLRVPGENPRSSDQAVVVLLCHDFLEGTVLGFAVCSSLMVIWWSCNASSDNVGYSFFSLRQSLIRAMHPPFSPLGSVLTTVCWRWCGQFLVVVTYWWGFLQWCNSLTGVHCSLVRLCSMVSAGSTTAPVQLMLFFGVVSIMVMPAISVVASLVGGFLSYKLSSTSCIIFVVKGIINLT